MLFLRKRGNVGNVFGSALECLRFLSVALTAGALWGRVSGKREAFSFLYSWDRRGEAIKAGVGAIGIMILRRSLSLCES